MGPKFDKFGPVMGENFPFYVVDACYAGECYLCVHDHGESIEKYKHHSLFVDLAGESRGDTMDEIDRLCGFMLDMPVNSTGKTEFCYRKAVVSEEKDQFILLVN